jgi:Skp family chaperone for outer membrane proteins
MNNERFQQVGWALAAAMAGVLLASGFQDSTSKTGVVDIAKVVETSNYGKSNRATFDTMKLKREELLKFLDENRAISGEQAQRLRDLMLKPNPNDAEKAETERIKAEAVASTKRATELNAKQNLTPEDRTLMQDYANRARSIDELTQRWFREFTSEMQKWADDQRVESLGKARTAIQEVAKAQGYTIVFEVGIAPFGSNDLTDASLQAMNAKP